MCGLLSNLGGLSASRASHKSRSMNFDIINSFIRHRRLQQENRYVLIVCDYQVTINDDLIYNDNLQSVYRYLCTSYEINKKRIPESSLLKLGCFSVIRGSPLPNKLCMCSFRER